MSVLLDTHALLWDLIEPDKLSRTARRLLEDDSTDVMVSAPSAWEIATKYRLGKLPGAKRVVADYAGALHGLQATQLALTGAHALMAGSRKVAHRDPFDRMLAAQAELGKLALVSCDPAMQSFGVEVVW